MSPEGRSGGGEAGQVPLLPYPLEVEGGDLLWLLPKLRFRDESLPPQGLDAPTTIGAPFPPLLEPLKLNQLWLHCLPQLAPTSWLWRLPGEWGEGMGRGVTPSAVPLRSFLSGLFTGSTFHSFGPSLTHHSASWSIFSTAMCLPWTSQPMALSLSLLLSRPKPGDRAVWRV